MFAVQSLLDFGAVGACLTAILALHLHVLRWFRADQNEARKLFAEQMAAERTLFAEQIKEERETCEHRHREIVAKLDELTAR